MIFILLFNFHVFNSTHVVFDINYYLYISFKKVKCVHEYIEGNMIS